MKIDIEITGKVTCMKCKVVKTTKTLSFPMYSSNQEAYKIGHRDFNQIPTNWVEYEQFLLCEKCELGCGERLKRLYDDLHEYIHGFRPK